jgi:hypothetical protein
VLYGAYINSSGGTTKYLRNQGFAKLTPKKTPESGIFRVFFFIFGLSKCKGRSK